MQKEQFYIPAQGQILQLSELNDDNFATGNLGPGFAIKLTGNTLHAPFDGTIIAAFPSGHAFLIRRQDGFECLMHVGVRSHTLSHAFKSDVVKYQKVKQGDVLTTFNLSEFKEDNRYCPIVFSSPETVIEFAKQDADADVGNTSLVCVTHP